MKESLIADKTPFQQSMLSYDDCYILDDQDNRKLFVWKGIEDGSLVHCFANSDVWFQVLPPIFLKIFTDPCQQGKGAKKEERDRAIDKARSFIKGKNYPKTTNVSWKITEKYTFAHAIL